MPVPTGIKQHCPHSCVCSIWNPSESQPPQQTTSNTNTSTNALHRDASAHPTNSFSVTQSTTMSSTLSCKSDHSTTASSTSTSSASTSSASTVQQRSDHACPCLHAQQMLDKILYQRGSSALDLHNFLVYFDHLKRAAHFDLKGICSEAVSVD